MYGKHHTPEIKRQIAESCHQIFSEPLVREQRSMRAQGEKNPMFGRTHSLEVKESSRQRLAGLRNTPEFRTAHQEAMRQPEVRRAISKAAALRVGDLNSFSGRTHSTETKQRIAQANRGRFQGANGSNWQGGKTSLAVLIRNSEPAVQWRKAVFDRDSFTCQLCGKVGGPLHADHIHPFALILDEYEIKTLEAAYECSALWDLTNGRTLCVPCHRKTSSFAGNFQKNFGRKR